MENIILIWSLWYIMPLMWCLLGYSVAVGEFNGDDDEGKKYNHSANFSMWQFICQVFVFHDI